MAKAKIVSQTINKKAVFEAASFIAKSYEMPTIRKIRDQLGGHGSETTLHKYLSLWKKELLDLAQHLGDKPFKTRQTENFNEEKIVSEKVLKEEKIKSKILSEELIKVEKENNELQDNLEAIQKELTEVMTQKQGLLAQLSHFQTLVQEMREEREVMVSAILSDKNKLIEALQKELKEINQDNLDYIKKVGFESDEAILSQKIKVINLEDKLDTLTKEIKSLKTELTKERERHLPLVQQIHKQKTFIQKIVSFEQMQEYEALMGKG